MNELNKSRDFHSIDVFRCLAMLLIVAIHMPFPGIFGMIVISFGKTAVPFFIIASGFFCYRENDEEFSKRLVKQIVKLLIVCIIANVLFCFILFYLSPEMTFVNYLKSMLTPEAVKKFLITNNSPFADHLWFLGSMVYAMLIVLLLVKIKAFNFVSLFSPLLLIVYIAMVFSGKIDFVYCRNALFCTMPYFMFGCLFRKYFDKVNTIPLWILVVATVISIAVSMLELAIHKSTGTIFIGTEFLTLFIFALLLRFKDFGANSIFESIGRRDVFFIYVIHFAFCFFFWIRYEELNPLFQWLAPLIIFLISWIVSEIYYVIKMLVCKIPHNSV